MRIHEAVEASEDVVESGVMIASSGFVTASSQRCGKCDDRPIVARIDQGLITAEKLGHGRGDLVANRVAIEADDVQRIA